LLSVCGLAGGPALNAQEIVSINLYSNPTVPSVESIDSGEPFGLTALGTEVGYWNNTTGNLSAGNVLFHNGCLSSVSFSKTGAKSSFAAGPDDTALRAGLPRYPSTPPTTESTVTLDNLNANFPEGYYVIVYLSGWTTNTRASISDGTTTKWYQTPTTSPFTLSETTQTSDLGEGLNPEATYAIFGSTASPLTADSITFALDNVLGGGTGIGGVQIVGLNLLGNGGFESGTPGPENDPYFDPCFWHRSVNQEFNIWLTDDDSTYPLLGADNQALAGDLRNVSVYQDFGAVAGEAYTFSVDYLNSTNANNRWQPRLEVEWYNTSGNMIGSTITVANADYATGPYQVWDTLSGARTAPANTAYGRIILTASNQGSNRDISLFDNAIVTGTAANSAPWFPEDPYSFTLDRVALGDAYSGSILSDFVKDANGDALTYTKLSGAAWLTVNPDGSLSGTPTGNDWQDSTFTFQVDDSNGGIKTATATVPVILDINYNVFIDATLGSDTNDGASSGTAWKTLESLNTKHFLPGVEIRFKRGEVFNGHWDFIDSGSSGQPIVVGAYGDELLDLPLLQGVLEYDAVIDMTDNQWVELSDLQIANNHTGPLSIHTNRFGIKVRPGLSLADRDIEHVYFRRLVLKDIVAQDNECRGISLLTPDDKQPWQADDTDGLRNVDENGGLLRWNDVLIEYCHFEDIDGRAVHLIDDYRTLAEYLNSGEVDPYHPTIGFLFQYNSGLNVTRNLLLIEGTKGAVVQYNSMHGTTNGSAFWCFNADDTLVQFNRFGNLRNANADAFICHFDYNSRDTLMQYNIGYDASGGLVEMLRQTSENSFQINAVARYNIGIDVGFRNNDKGAAILVSGGVNGGKIYNNTILNLSIQNQYKAISFGTWNGWPKNMEIYNNIFYAAGSIENTFNEADRFATGNPDGNIVSNNLYYGNITPPAGDTLAITADPQFHPSLDLSNPSSIDPSTLTAEHFKVIYGSPAIASGTLIADNGGLDYFGNTVSTSSAPTVGAHEYSSDAKVDSDQGTVPDAWELLYSLNPLSGADDSLDSDSDGWSNADEYIANTNPLNATSSLSLSITNGGLNWPEDPDRTYYLWESPDLSNWTQTPTTPVSSPLTLPMEADKMFYRVAPAVP
jgi:hypothetical protein